MTYDFPPRADGQRFYLAEMGRDYGELAPMRRNDGSLIIMERADLEYTDARPVLLVARVADVKRSEAHSAADPDQLAFAFKVLALLNATA